MSKSQTTHQQPSSEEIAACAYRIYEREGRPNGRSMQHWLQAEAKLIAERKNPAATASENGDRQQQSRKPGNFEWNAPSRSQPAVHTN